MAGRAGGARLKLWPEHHCPSPRPVSSPWPCPDVGNPPTQLMVPHWGGGQQVWPHSKARRLEPDPNPTVPHPASAALSSHEGSSRLGLAEWHST